MNPTTGAIGGVPTGSGVADATLTVTDADGASASRVFPIAVSAGSTLRVTQVSAGGDHTCAVLSNGVVKCWGFNRAGQLGNGTRTSANTPQTVTGLGGPAASVSAGGGHTCAVLTSGAAKCWGANVTGQLGNGSTTDSSTPVPVSGLTTDVTAISAGAYHSCAVLSGGSARCWGGNNSGQLGNGTRTDSASPVAVTGMGSGVTAISAGNSNLTCALVAGGAAKCWGEGRQGQLGNGSTGSSSVPVSVTGLRVGSRSISAGGDLACAVTTGGKARCWGDNYTGQLGSGDAVSANTPVDVTTQESGVAASSAGGFHACALRLDGTVWCWGNSLFLGDGASDGSGSSVREDSATIAVATSIRSVSAVSAGGSHTCAVTSAGGVLCWGGNYSGQLGDGTKRSSGAPVAVIGLR